MQKLVPFSTLNYSYATPTEEKHFAHFFSKLNPGETFLYSGYWMGQDIALLAKKHGLEVEILNCSELKGEYGCRVLPVNPFQH